jgi:hypothetical protein
VKESVRTETRKCHAVALITYSHHGRTIWTLGIGNKGNPPLIESIFFILVGYSQDITVWTKFKNVGQMASIDGTQKHRLAWRSPLDCRIHVDFVHLVERHEHKSLLGADSNILNVGLKLSKIERVRCGRSRKTRVVNEGKVSKLRLSTEIFLNVVASEMFHTPKAEAKT